MTGDAARLVWHLPGEALIEFEVRCRLGLRSNSPCPASAISHSGGPRAGAMRGGDVASPSCARIWRTAGASVMKAMMRTAANEPLRRRNLPLGSTIVHHCQGLQLAAHRHS